MLGLHLAVRGLLPGGRAAVGEVGEVVVLHVMIQIADRITVLVVLDRCLRQVELFGRG